MVYQVKTVNGQKTKIPLSGSVPTGNPIGSLISTYKKIQPKNYLYCDGSFFDQNQYPALYLYLGSNQLPDYRECTMVGAEQNTTDNIATHDVYAQGEFKDDQNKSHHHTIYGRTAGGTSSISNTYPISTHGIIGHASSNLEYAETTSAGGSTNNIIGDEGGDVARGKRKAVYVYIKAVDGVDITDEDMFLNTVKDYVDSKNGYSTDETLTGGTWIDGKPIYRRVLVLPSSMQLDTTWRNVIADWGIDFIVKSFCYGSPTSTYGFETAIIMRKDNNNIQARVENRSLYSDMFLVEYTKTTD